MIHLRYFITLFIFLCFGILQTSAQVITPAKPPEENDKKKIALEHYRNREYQKAIVLYEEIIEENDNNTYYTYLLNCYIGIRDFREANKLVRRKIKENPQDLKFKVDRAFLMIQEGDEKKGKKAYEKLIEDLSGNTRQIQQLASAFNFRQETKYAIQTYLKGREISGNKTLFSLELGMQYGRTGEFSLMYDEFLTTLLTNENRVSSVKSRIGYYFRQDQSGEQKELFKGKLIRMLQKHSSVKAYSDLMLWYSLQVKDYQTALDQAISIDKRYKEDGRTLYNLANVCRTAGAFKFAESAFEQILEKGPENQLYLAASVDLVKTRFQRLTEEQVESSELRSFEQEIKSKLKEIKLTTLSFDMVRYLAQLQAYHLNNTDSAIAYLNKAINIRGLRHNQKSHAKVDLADVYMISGDPWEAILLYAQVHTSNKNSPLGHDAKLRHAKVSYYIGEFSWAETQLNVLKAATSKLIANDALELSLLISNNLSADSLNIPLKMFARADLLYFKQDYENAMITLDSLSSLNQEHEMQDEALYKKAEILIGQRKFEEADSILILLNENYPKALLADNAVFKRIQIQNEFLNNKELTIALCEQFLELHKGSIFTEEIRKLYRNLTREDKSEETIEFD